MQQRAAEVPSPGKFQSLFSWNLLLMMESIAAIMAVDPVSILVFVELALDAARGWMISRGRTGFNPCFRGTCS